jgi:hypothetical protein
MTKSTKKTSSRPVRRRGRPKTDRRTTSIGVRLDDEMIAQVDEFKTKLRRELGAGWQINRGDAIRALLTRGLSCSGSCGTEAGQEAGVGENGV